MGHTAYLMEYCRRCLDRPSVEIESALGGCSNAEETYNKNLTTPINLSNSLADLAELSNSCRDGWSLMVE